MVTPNSTYLTVGAEIVKESGNRAILDIYEFIKEIKRENRFFPNNKSVQIVDKIIEHSKQYKCQSFKEGNRLYRARINTLDMGDQYYLLDEMDAPPPTKSTSGRLNPAGISYLYLADHMDTAVSEVRPWAGCKITIAEFVLKRGVNVINFSKLHFMSARPSDNENEFELVWRELVAKLFSTPFDKRDETAYIPTQYLRERIKNEGFDGILYDSALRPEGYNVALFDKNNAQIRGEEIYVTEVKSITYKIGETKHYRPTN